MAPEIFWFCFRSIWCEVYKLFLWSLHGLRSFPGQKSVVGQQSSESIWFTLVLPLVVFSQRTVKLSWMYIHLLIITGITFLLSMGNLVVLLPSLLLVRSLYYIKEILNQKPEILFCKSQTSYLASKFLSTRWGMEKNGNRDVLRFNL